MLYGQIERLVGMGVESFYTGMALGVDQWGALAVLQLKRAYPNIRLVAVLPCETQADKWSSSLRRRYFDEILPRADDSILICRAYTKTCMLERNRYLVESCDFLLAVCEGVSQGMGTGQSKGGTAYTIAYARRLNKKIIAINPESLKVYDSL